MQPMLVLTVKKDGGTQDVKDFYVESELIQACEDAESFMAEHLSSKHVCVRLEWYNPHGHEATK